MLPLKGLYTKITVMSLLRRTNTYFILKPNTGGGWVWRVCFAVGVVSLHCLPSQPNQLIPLYPPFSPAAVLSPPRHTVHISGSLRSISDHCSTFLSSLYILDNLYENIPIAPAALALPPQEVCTWTFSAVILSHAPHVMLHKAISFSQTEAW